MGITRREAMIQGLIGAGGIGLRALATGLPTVFFTNPRQAMAQTAPTARYLILSTSSGGDPLNCNAPGAYAQVGPNFIHPSSTDMTPVRIQVGSQASIAAAPWATMPSDVLARTAFIHHATGTANHGDQNNVMRLMGAVRRGEMATSLFSNTLASTLGTIQKQPVALGHEVTIDSGIFQPSYTPTGVKSVLLGPTSPLNALQALRDAELARVNELYKQSRNTSAERAFVDNLAMSQTQLRALSESFADDLQSITDDGPDSQALMAVILAKMKVAPMFTIHIPFGGDNHTDPDFMGETEQTVAGVASINLLMQRLKSYDLLDQVTFASLNVFGRTFDQVLPGRTHNGGHHVTVVIGANISGGIYGGLSPSGNAFNIAPDTGQGVASGGIELLDTLAAVGKTLGSAIGVPTTLLDDQITRGVVIQPVLS